MKDNLNKPLGKKLKLDLTSINKNQDSSILNTQKYCATTRGIIFTKTELDYTFRNHKKRASEGYIPGVNTTRQNKEIIYKNKNVSEKVPELQDYMEDLIKTWKLNMDFISNFIQAYPDILSKNESLSILYEKNIKNDITLLINNILQLHDKKLLKIKEASENRSVILMNKQIEEENRRIKAVFLFSLSFQAHQVD